MTKTSQEHMAEAKAVGRSFRRAVLLLVLLIGVTACSSDDTYLPALRADPMADLELSGARLVFRDDSAENQKPFLAMPTQAAVLRSFLIDEPHQADDAMAEAMAYAESVGWTFEERRASGNYVAHKELEPGLARLSLALIEDAEGPELVIRMTFWEHY